MAQSLSGSLIQGCNGSPTSPKYDPGGYSYCGLTGGLVRTEEGQCKTFEKYPQMAVYFLQKPSNGS